MATSVVTCLAVCWVDTWALGSSFDPPGWSYTRNPDHFGGSARCAAPCKMPAGALCVCLYVCLSVCACSHQTVICDVQTPTRQLACSYDPLPLLRWLAATPPPMLPAVFDVGWRKGKCPGMLCCWLRATLVASGVWSPCHHSTAVSVPQLSCFPPVKPVVPDGTWGVSGLMCPGGTRHQVAPQAAAEDREKTLSVLPS